MKSVESTLLDRRSIRRYEYDPVTPEQMQFIHQAIRNTPTSYNGQQFSVIEIDDPEIKQQLFSLTNQKQIKTCSRFLLFCADFHKISIAAAHKDVAMPQFTHTLDGIIVGTVDASLAMMSAVVAAESLGLGTCCIGYARTAAPDAIAEILRLPAKVYAVCGLAIGVPREMPDLKPKQPEPLVIHHNTYTPDERLLPLLTEYDNDVTYYNTHRAGSKSTNDWIAHIVSYYTEAMDYKMLEALRHRDFSPDR